MDKYLNTLFLEIFYSCIFKTSFLPFAKSAFKERQNSSITNIHLSLLLNFVTITYSYSYSVTASL